MKIYSVYETSWSSSAGGSVFVVKEGFHWLAFFLGPVWLLSFAMWLPMSVYLVCASIFIIFSLTLDVGYSILMIAIFGANICCGIGASWFLQMSLESMGCEFSYLMVARNKRVAELQSFLKRLSVPPVQEFKSGMVFEKPEAF